MGVTVNEMMSDRFFSDYKFIAGRSGGNRVIHAATVFDAPDGYKWFRGKELVLSTGFLFVDNMELFKEIIRFLNSKNVAGMGIKTSRYLHSIPQEIINLADSLNFPLIEIPGDVAWIDIISQINSIAINRFINSVIERTILKDTPLKPYNLKKKVDEILTCLENEIKAPISVLNLVDKTIFTTPSTFKPSVNRINFEPIEEYDFSYRRDVISDKPKIFRFTDLESVHRDSWLVIPITIKGLTISKIIIWEKDVEIDYYSMFSVKVSIALLYELYEHIYSMNNIEGKYYDEFLSSLVNGELNTKQKIRSAISNFLNFSLNIDSSFICICVLQDKEDRSLYEERERLFNNVLYKLPNSKCIFGIIDDNTILILYDISRFKDVLSECRSEMIKLLKELDHLFPEREFRIGIGDVIDNIVMTKRSFMEAKKAIEIGSYLYPKLRTIAFYDLGPFGVLTLENVESKKFGSSIDKIKPLLQEENSKELIETLKVYLESNLNYKQAANKLFIHNNTVRYRINKIEELCNIDLNDYIERLKIEILLRFL
jgi:purine catabolism regulator